MVSEYDHEIPQSQTADNPKSDYKNRIFFFNFLQIKSINMSYYHEYEAVQLQKWLFCLLR